MRVLKIKSWGCSWILRASLRQCNHQERSKTHFEKILYFDGHFSVFGPLSTSTVKNLPLIQKNISKKFLNGLFMIFPTPYSTLFEMIATRNSKFVLRTIFNLSRWKRFLEVINFKKISFDASFLELSNAAKHVFFTIFYQKWQLFWKSKNYLVEAFSGLKSTFDPHRRQSSFEAWKYKKKPLRSSRRELSNAA